MQKHNGPEILDLGKPYYQEEEYQECLSYLGKIAKYLGGDRASFWALDKIQGKPSSIIDFGCGGGDFSAKLAKRYPDCKIIGVDSSQDAISFAKSNVQHQNLPNLEYQLIDHNHYQLPADSVDIIITSLTCHHMTDNQIIQFIKMSSKAARLGVVINDLHRSWVAWLAFKLMAPLFFNNRLIKHDGPLSIRRAFKYNEWKQYLTAAGLEFENYTIKWRWAYRWIVLIADPKKSSISS